MQISHVLMASHRAQVPVPRSTWGVVDADEFRCAGPVFSDVFACKGWGGTKHEGGGRDLGTNFSSLSGNTTWTCHFFFGMRKPEKKVCCFHFHIMEGF